MVSAIFTSLASAGLGIFLGLNSFILQSARPRIVSPEKAGESNADCILILGCRPQANGEPSHMLEDRLRRSVELYRAEAAPVILASGNDGTGPHGGRNEIEPMLRYLLNAGISGDALLVDRESYSTFDNINRAKTAFGMTRPLVVTQEYHLPRALMIARELGLDAHGVPSDYRRYQKPIKRHVREALARCKDFVKMQKGMHAK